MAWLNSDDKYVSWAFSIVAEIFATFPQVEWLTTSYGLNWDRAGRAVRCGYYGGFNRHAFFRGSYLQGRDWYATGSIQQESTFWRRSLWDRAGGRIDASLKLAGDFDLWAKFFCHTNLYAVCTPLGGFRIHENQKTAHHMQGYLEEAEISLRRYGGHPYGKFESAIRSFLNRSVGRGQINGLPFPIEILNKLNIFYPVKRCFWSDQGWQIVDGYIETFEKYPLFVIPAQAGIQKVLKGLDFCFRRNDDLPNFRSNSKLSYCVTTREAVLEKICFVEFL